MDFNIAAALKMASKGEGYILKENNKIDYRSQAKIIFSGLGNIPPFLF